MSSNQLIDKIDEISPPGRHEDSLAASQARRLHLNQRQQQLEPAPSRSAVHSLLSALAANGSSSLVSYVGSNATTHNSSSLPPDLDGAPFELQLQSEAQKPAENSDGQQQPRLLLLLFALLVLINLIVILGNLLVIAAVYASAKLRNVTNIFIVSLATADLMLGLLVLPYALVYEVSNAASLLFAMNFNPASWWAPARRGLSTDL